MEPRDVIHELSSSERRFDFGSAAVLEHNSYTETWIQYLTPQMREMLGVGIHYEFKTHYTRLCVYLHDERGRRDALWRKLREIARWHGLLDEGSIVFYCPGKIRDFDDEAVLPMVERSLRELFDVFHPFFAHVFEGLERGLSVDSAVKEYRVEDDALSATAFIRRVVTEDQKLDLGEGVMMSPNKKWKWYDGWDGWQIYKSYLNDDNVHFEVRLKGGDVSVELHDERGQYDALRRILYREAVRNDFPIEVNDTGLWIGQKEGAHCSRRYDLILRDVSRLMRNIWNVYGKLLDGVSKEGRVPCKMSAIPPMMEIPHRTYPPNAKPRKDIHGDTLSWVMTVSELAERAPIPLSSTGAGNTLMIPGQYVIPSYQRRYAWTADNVNQLCRDLLRASQTDKSSYHLGTLIFHAPKDGKYDGTFFVVDGQQRLRTISRLLSQQIFTENEEHTPEKQFSSEDEENIWQALQRFRANDKSKILSMLRKSTFVCIAVDDITESFQLFSTQNGRGKTLSPENLLKAYHFHEIREAEKRKDDELDDLDTQWERLNRTVARGDGLLLHQVIGEHLYRIRCWLRGDFPKDPFSARRVGAFKGLTVYSTGEGSNILPLGNLSTLRRNGNVDDPKLARRTSSDKMNPFVFIDQPIVNGSDFFNYVSAYCRAYEILFGGKEYRDLDLNPFYAYYATFCLYPRCGRRGDEYARHIFQSLCLYCFDRFGATGLNASYEFLYCCAYYERAVNTRCYYQTCGDEFTLSAIQVMANTSNLVDLTERLSELHIKVCECFDEQGAAAVEGLECVHAAFSREGW